MTISFADIHPLVRYAQRLKITDSSNFLGLCAYDHRFFFCQSGHGTITVEGKDYPMERGCLIIWRSGMKYDLKNKAGEELMLLGANFDFTTTGKEFVAAIPPTRTEVNRKNIVEEVTFSDAECLNGVLYINNMYRLEADIEHICDEYLQNRTFFRAKNSGIFMSVLTEAVREGMLENVSIRRSKKKVEEILAYIAQHYGEEITNFELGRRFGYHPNYINHLVVQHTGMSLHKYVLRFRINKAVELLQTTDLSVVRISEKCGFYDYNHFLKYFKQVTGYTTKAFRG